MAFNEALAERIRHGLVRKKGIEERKMFGGIGFRLHGNMLVGVWKESLIARLGPAETDLAPTVATPGQPANRSTADQRDPGPPERAPQALRPP